MWCKHCGRDQPGYTDEINGYTCCTGCGKVIDQDLFSSEVTFLKTSSGQSRVAGSFVKSVRDSGTSESHERTLAKGRNEINDIVSGLEMSGGESLIDQAHRLYTIAVERNFTRGRRTNQVAASCIYIICRLEKKPYLLIDFSEFLQINVYVLGAVFLQLCQLLRLVQHPIVQKPVDPSLFMPRYASMLVTSKEMERKDMHALCREISVTAVRIIASMKRDWIQTGRKPNGLCGAALYVSALSCGISCSKSDVVNIVHVCDATLTKRLIEFENTESGSLTIDSFIEKAKEFEADAPRVTANIGLRTQGSSEVLCEHKDRGATNFLHGLCRKCYDDFVEISGGIQGGSDPPAFQRAERERTLKATSDENNDAQSNTVGDEPNMSHKDGKGLCSQAGSEFSVSEGMASNNSESANHVTKDFTSNNKNLDSGEDGGDKENLMNKRSPENMAVDENSPAKVHQDEGVGNVEDDEAETLSDIDDAEVDGYLHDEEETRLKTIIWTEMNKEYLEEQAAKEAAIAAAQAAYEANLSNCADMPGAFEVAAVAAAAVAKLKKERQQKRAEEAKNNTPAQTAAEATRRMLTKKRLSSRINYDVLEKLFDDTDKEQLHKDLDTTAKGDVKKQKTESAEIDGFSQPLDDADVDDQAFQSDVFDGDVGADVGHEHGEYDTYSYHGNQSNCYGYDDEYGYDDY